MMKGETIAFRGSIHINRPVHSPRPNPLSKPFLHQTFEKAKSLRSEPSLHISPPPLQTKFQITTENQNSNRTKNPQIVHSKQMTSANQKEFQKIIRSYQLKIKQMEDDHYHQKLDFQKKMEILRREKIHWQNVAVRRGGSIIANENIDVSQIAKKEFKEKLEQEKHSINKEKEELKKQLYKLSAENFNLRQAIAEFSQNNNQLRMKSLSQPSLAQTNQSSNSKLPPTPPKQKFQANSPLPHNQTTRTNQNLRLACQKMHTLLSSINQQIVKKSLSQLNKKYELEYNRF